MNVKCILTLHDWANDCENCARCGKTRNRRHDWSRSCERCAICKKTRSGCHKWNGCRCSTCGSDRLDGHRWVGDACGICGVTRSGALAREIQQAMLKGLAMQLHDDDALRFDRLRSEVLIRIPASFPLERQARLSSIEEQARLSFEKRREQHLREALEPVAEKWGRSVDQLLPIASAENKLEMAAKVLSAAAQPRKDSIVDAQREGARRLVRQGTRRFFDKYGTSWNHQAWLEFLNGLRSGLRPNVSAEELSDAEVGQILEAEAAMERQRHPRAAPGQPMAGRGGQDHGNPADLSPDTAEPLVALRCSKCQSVYGLGSDAISITSEELAQMMPNLVGTLPHGIMIGRAEIIDRARLQGDRATILRLGPLRGWTCKECHQDNPWRPIASSAAPPNEGKPSRAELLSGIAAMLSDLGGGGARTASVEAFSMMQCPPFLGQATCSDNQCPCANTTMPPAQGYLWIEPEVAESRKGCLSMSALQERMAATQTSAMNIEEMRSRYLPIVVCKEAAMRRNLDLGTALADYATWVQTGSVPCRPTPLAR
jgi:hypothetical protein